MQKPPGPRKGHVAEPAARIGREHAQELSSSSHESGLAQVKHHLIVCGDQRSDDPGIVVVEEVGKHRHHGGGEKASQPRGIVRAGHRRSRDAPQEHNPYTQFEESSLQHRL